MDMSIGNNLPRVKVQNQYAIKEIVYKFGPISRIEIADRLGLTLPTITTSVSTMIKNGLLKEVELSPDIKTLGRRTMLVDINENSRRFLGIEIRGFARSAVIIDTRGRVLASLRDERHVVDYMDAITSASSLAVQVVRKAGLDFSAIDGIGLTSPGIIDNLKGMLVIHPGYKWSSREMVADFVHLSGYQGETNLENNAIARAFGFSMFEGNVLGDVDSMAYMFISSGIGCPLLNNVKSHFGIVTGDGEVGHMVMNPEGPVCACGNRGCLEAYTSESAIVSKAMDAVKNGRSSTMAALVTQGHDLSVEDVLKASEKGDKEARAIIDDAIRYLGLAIANIENFVRPECMVIECKLFDNEQNRAALLATIHANLYRAAFSDLRVYFKKSDEFSGAKGAAATALKRNLELFLE